MALETATHINDLVIANPTGLDDLSQGDDHLRLIKDVLKRDLPLTTPATSIGIAILTTATESAARTTLQALSVGYMQVRDEKANATNGGSSISGDQTRILNTLVSNSISGASLATNQITLPVGSYRVKASAPAYNIAGHQLRLANITDGTVIIRGTNEYAFGTMQTRSIVEGKFTIAAIKVISLAHYTSQVVATNGLGVAINIGAIENYTTIEIWQE